MGWRCGWLVVVVAACSCGAAASASFEVGDVTEPDEKATHLIVVPSIDAVKAVEPLAAYRSEHGQVSRILNLQKLATTYAPDVDRNWMLQRYLLRCPKLKHVLLVGNPRGDGKLLMPAFTVDAHCTSDRYPTDDRFVTDHPYSTLSDKSDSPRLAVGRFPARSLDDVKTMVAKTLAYEKSLKPGAWRRRIEIFAGQGYYGPQIDAALETMFKVIMTTEVPHHWDVKLAYAKPGSLYCYAPSKFSDHLIDRLNSGPALALYVGHGHEQGFDSFYWRRQRYAILNDAAVGQVKVPDHRSVVISIACSTGKFDGRSPSIGERLLTSPTGPVAFLGSSRISQPYANGILAGYIADAMIKTTPATLGDGLQDVRRMFAEDRMTRLRMVVDLAAGMALPREDLPKQRRDQLALYNLFGDPALSIGLVSGRATIEAPKQAKPGEKIIVKAASDAVSEGEALFELTISRASQKTPLRPVAESDPSAETKMAATNAAANDKVLRTHRTSVRDGGASWSLQLPADLEPGQYHVNVYVRGWRADALGTAMIVVE